MNNYLKPVVSSLLLKSMKRLFIFICCIGIVFNACSSVKKSFKTTLPPEETEVSDTMRVAADTSPPVIDKKTQDSVALAVYRLIKDTVSVIGVGDIMMGTNYPDKGYLPPNNGQYLMDKVNRILNDADVTFGNLEGVLLNEGGDAKRCNDPKACYIFRSPEILAGNLLKAGFDVMSTANNHAGDFGGSGRENTTRVLDSLGIHHAGLVSQPYTTFMIEGMKYGFAAFAPNTGTMSINDIPEARKIVSRLDSVSDIVIVSFHGGAEGSRHEHVTKESEYFYGENRGNVYRFAREVIDAGADIVFGHGPHVTRALDVYKKRIIAYSLGNFCTYARFNLRGVNGIAPILKVFVKPDGEFLYGHITPIVQISPGGAKPDPENRVIKKLQVLTKNDFPQLPLVIDDNGRIDYLQK